MTHTIPSMMIMMMMAIMMSRTSSSFCIWLVRKWVTGEGETYLRLYDWSSCTLVSHTMVMIMMTMRMAMVMTMMMMVVNIEKQDNCWRTLVIHSIPTTANTNKTTRVPDPMILKTKPNQNFRH